MGDVKGFMKYGREGLAARPPKKRLKDFRECYEPLPEDRLKQQAARCMDCGTPFCHTSFSGCPINNIIPDWNDLVYRNRWKEALAVLHSTNNFPEFTGRVCPAPCEGACVLGINEPPVTIKNIEMIIIDHGFKEGWVKPRPPEKETGKSVAVVGSGPAGLACAQQLRRAGHAVTVYEKSDRIGGLLIYGIPDFKLEKHIVDRRVALMAAEGVRFQTKAHVGENISVAELKKKYDAIVLAGGAQQPRDLPIEGRDLDGVHFAMDFLPQQNRRVAGEQILPVESITATGKHVIVIGGGDTGSDCVGTSLRQGCRSLTSFELLPKPPEDRMPDNPWPLWPKIFRTSSSHAEGGRREYSVLTKRFIGENGKVKKLQACRVAFETPKSGGRPQIKEVPGSEFELPADLVLLAMGFLGPIKTGMIDELGVELDARGNVKAGENKMTSVPGIFTAGDMTRGQSLVVWAIQEGRAAARGVDHYLMGTTDLP